MNLNEYEIRQQKIISEIETHIKIDNHLNMLHALRNDLEASLKQINALIEEVDYETFKTNLKECPVWYNSERKISVQIDKVDWVKEIIHWHNVNDEYPTGVCMFEHFRELCYPVWQ